VLLLALAYIALTVGLLALIAAGASQLGRVDRHERQALILRQMIDSGRAWALVHQNDEANPSAVTLDAQELIPAPASGAITVVSTRGTPDTRATVTVIAQLQLRAPERTLTKSATFEHSKRKSP